MNPKPLVPLNHFTTPSAIAKSFGSHAQVGGWRRPNGNRQTADGRRVSHRQPITIPCARSFRICYRPAGVDRKRTSELGRKGERPTMATSDSGGVAFVTGASRGIGQACAVYLARAGFDVAISARTVGPDEEREHSPTIHHSDTRPLAGNLRETEAMITEAGRRAVLVPADLLDHASLEAAAATTLEAFGRVDVVVH